jgi:hypothetical protein
MTDMRRYTAAEVAEFVIASADLTGLNEAEVIEALEEHAQHMNDAGHRIGMAEEDALKEILAYFESPDLDIETSALLMYAEARDALARLQGAGRS